MIQMLQLALLLAAPVAVVELVDDGQPRPELAPAGAGPAVPVQVDEQVATGRFEVDDHRRRGRDFIKE